MQVFLILLVLSFLGLFAMLSFAKKDGLEEIERTPPPSKQK